MTVNSIDVISLYYDEHDAQLPSNVTVIMLVELVMNGVVNEQNGSVVV
jgi:hypothetical protein